MNARIRPGSAVESAAMGAPRKPRIVVRPKARKAIMERLEGKPWKNHEAADTMNLALDLIGMAEQMDAGDHRPKATLRRLLSALHGDKSARDLFIERIARRANSIRDGVSGDWSDPEVRAWVAEVEISGFSRQAGRQWKNRLLPKIHLVVESLDNMVNNPRGGRGKKSWKEPFAQLCSDLKWPADLSKVKT